METQNIQEKEPMNDMNFWGSEKNRKTSKIVAGIFLMIWGGLLLAKQSGAIIPHWVLNFGTLLIAIGIISGVKRGFNIGGWMILVLIGTFITLKHALNLYFLGNIFWPIVLIAIGLLVIFKPRNKQHFWRHNHAWGRRWHEQYATETINSEDVVDCTAVLGGVKKKIISKSFKGGEVTAFFGGVDIDLSEADIQGTVVLETTAIFGGAKLIIPRNWNLRSEATAVLGGIEDKRIQVPNLQPDENKTLVLVGTAVFGGIEIKSY